MHSRENSVVILEESDRFSNSVECDLGVLRASDFVL